MAGTCLAQHRNKRSHFAMERVKCRRSVNEFRARTSISTECRIVHWLQRCFMKGLSGTLLALVFVFFSLLSLMSVHPNWDSSMVQLDDSEARVSELGLRFAMGR